jgi:hypothetical protein
MDLSAAFLNARVIAQGLLLFLTLAWRFHHQVPRVSVIGNLCNQNQ